MITVQLPEGATARRGALQMTEQAARSLRGAISSAIGGGRPKSSDRCACGKYTRARAASRKHVCEAKEPAPQLPPPLNTLTVGKHRTKSPGALDVSAWADITVDGPPWEIRVHVAIPRSLPEYGPICEAIWRAFMGLSLQSPQLFYVALGAAPRYALEFSGYVVEYTRSDADGRMQAEIVGTGKPELLSVSGEPGQTSSTT